MIPTRSAAAATTTVRARAEAERAYRLGRAVRDRRLALGPPQVELATRAGMTKPALSRLEAGGGQELTDL
jgi:Helix-turn-helix